jgi:hypothetical protein
MEGGSTDSNKKSAIQTDKDGLDRSLGALLDESNLLRQWYTKGDSGRWFKEEGHRLPLERRVHFVSAKRVHQMSSNV